MGAAKALVAKFKYPAQHEGDGYDDKKEKQ